MKKRSIEEKLNDFRYQIRKKFKIENESDKANTLLEKTKKFIEVAGDEAAEKKYDKVLKPSTQYKNIEELFQILDSLIDSAITQKIINDIDPPDNESTTEVDNNSSEDNDNSTENKSISNENNVINLENKLKNKKTSELTPSEKHLKYDKGRVHQMRVNLKTYNQFKELTLSKGIKPAYLVNAFMDRFLSSQRQDLLLEIITKNEIDKDYLVRLIEKTQ